MFRNRASCESQFVEKLPIIADDAANCGGTHCRTPVDFRQIRYALSVAKERSFTNAAVRLNISQSAVSEQVKLLEDEIGFPLFRRTPRGIEVTERGRTFLYEAERVVNAAASRCRAARRAIWQRSKRPWSISAVSLTVIGFSDNGIAKRLLTWPAPPPHTFSRTGPRPDWSPA